MVRIPQCEKSTVLEKRLFKILTALKIRQTVSVHMRKSIDKIGKEREDNQTERRKDRRTKNIIRRTDKQIYI